MQIQVGSLHTEEMIKDELRQMLMGGDSGLTLGMLMLLALEQSPYVFGGTLTEGDLCYAYELSDKKMTREKFHKCLVSDLEAAWRAFEIIAPDPELKQKGKTSQVEMFSPEWLADTIGLASQSLPSLTCREILWELPLAMTTHLAMATARRNGTLTERPADIRGALEQMRKMREKEQKEQNHG